MYVNKISTYNHVPTFKSNVVVDIGGSQREGSCKMRYETTEDTQPILTEDTTVNDLGKSRFQDACDFKNHIVKRIGKVQKDGRRIVKEKGYDPSENAIKNVTIFLPSYTSDNYAFYLPNHRNINDRPLKDLDFRNLKKEMIDSGLEIAPDMKFKVLQDAMGTGIAVTQRLYDNGMLNEGSYYTAVITGGGCGIANIEMPDSEKVIIKSSGSRYFIQGNNMVKVSAEGASAPSFIRNFCKSMKMNDELIEDIKSCHRAEFTTSEVSKLPRNVKTEKLKELLLESGMFEINDKNPDFIITKVKDQYRNRFDQARRHAIHQYCLALAGLGSIKKNEGSNGMIITGKFARALDMVARKHYKQGLAEWTMRLMAQSYDSYEIEKMQQAAYHFEVMCDDRFFIDNNTECGKLAHKVEYVNPIRGNWIKLNVANLKND